MRAGIRLKCRRSPCSREGKMPKQRACMHGQAACLRSVYKAWKALARYGSSSRGVYPDEPRPEEGTDVPGAAGEYALHSAA